MSAHTAIGKMNGLTEDQIENNRQGLSNDSKTQAGLLFARQVTKNKAIVNNDDIVAVKNAGYTDEDILEIVLNVVANTLTNYTNHLAETEIDFPKVEAGKFSVA